MRFPVCLLTFDPAIRHDIVESNVSGRMTFETYISSVQDLSFESYVDSMKFATVIINNVATRVISTKYGGPFDKPNRNCQFKLSFL